MGDIKKYSFEFQFFSHVFNQRLLKVKDISLSANTDLSKVLYNNLKKLQLSCSNV